MIDASDLGQLPGSARDAVKVAAERVERAASANDTEATIGASKDLLECVAKAALDALGTPYGSDAHIDKLASETLAALKRTSALQGRAPLERLSSSLVNAATAVAQLRNTDGTGHGRASRSHLDPAHAEFARAATYAWCRWVLAACRRALKDRAGLDQAFSDIGGARTFGRGQLADYLAELGVEGRGEDDQRKLGLAVARRWSVNGTFMPLVDVIGPVVEGRVEYPPPFCEGLVEGLVLDHNGFLIMTPDNIRSAIGVGRRLPGSRMVGAFGRLADRVSDAQPAPGFDESQQDQAIVALRSIASEEELPAVRDALARMAGHVKQLRGASPSSGSLSD